MNLLAAANIVPQVLCSLQLADTNAHVVYTVASNEGTIVKQGVVTNVSQAAVLFTLSVVPSGGADDATRVIYSQAVGGLTSVPLGPYLSNLGLQAGDAIWAIAAAAATIDLEISGLVLS